MIMSMKDVHGKGQWIIPMENGTGSIVTGIVKNRAEKECLKLQVNPD